MTNEVSLSQLSRVPRVKKNELKRLEKAKRLSTFTLEVLRFTSGYRGRSVTNYLQALRQHMRDQVDAGGVWTRVDARPIKHSSIHTLIRKALVHAEL